MMESRNEVIFSDLGSLCKPTLNISPLKELYKWNSVPYETPEVSGTMLSSWGKGQPQDVTLEPELVGWYRIYVALGRFGSVRQKLHLQLSSEDSYMRFSHSPTATGVRNQIEEGFWRCADMTGESVIIGKDSEGLEGDAQLAWLRFVPMNADEVEAYKAEQNRIDTKRLYASNDMYTVLWMFGLRGELAWHSLVKDYIQSDVEWLSIENMQLFDGQCSTGNADNFTHIDEGRKYVDQRLQEEVTLDRMADLVEYGHKNGLKMCMATRMGAWGMEYPYDQCHYDNSFTEQHLELRCIDRDGTPIDALSYLYPEVQEYIIKQFIDMASLGCDAVEMMYHRGVPYILFEQPFVDMFQERYGEDPRYLPLDDEKVTQLRCEIMNSFVKKLRTRLDEAFGVGKVKLHARVQFSLWDCRHVGLDVETWAREGLISAIISYPQRVREVLRGDIWQEENSRLLDLEKYTRYARENPEQIIYRKHDFSFQPPMEDSRGIPRGPVSQRERVEEFMALEKKYGVTVYFDIMPRSMTPEETRQRALELYNLGCEHISLWDTYQRAYWKVDWSMMRRLGHKDELDSYNLEKEDYYRHVRVLKIGKKDVSRYMPRWGG